MRVRANIKTRPRSTHFSELLVEFEGDKGTVDEGTSGRLILGLGGDLIMQYGEHEGVIDTTSLFTNWVSQLRRDAL